MNRRARPPDDLRPNRPRDQGPGPPAATGRLGNNRLRRKRRSPGQGDAPGLGFRDHL